MMADAGTRADAGALLMQGCLTGPQGRELGLAGAQSNFIHAFWHPESGTRHMAVPVHYLHGLGMEMLVAAQKQRALLYPEVTWA